MQLFTAYQHGKPVGRISAQIDELRTERYADATGHFGVLEGYVVTRASLGLPPARIYDARGAVERTLAQQGLRPAVTALQAKDRRVEITFEAIDFAALTRLVDALGREARVYPVEALLATRTAPGSVRAEVAFAP